jgi:ABC-type Fe3+/spermidine/putrescine transport system ATPase subunit
MRNLNQQKALTFVLVTHDQGVGALCDRIVRMRDGEIVGQDINPNSPPNVSASSATWWARPARSRLEPSEALPQ